MELFDRFYLTYGFFFLMFSHYILQSELDKKQLLKIKVSVVYNIKLARENENFIATDNSLT